MRLHGTTRYPVILAVLASSLALAGAAPELDAPGPGSHVGANAATTLLLFADADDEDDDGVSDRDQVHRRAGSAEIRWLDAPSIPERRLLGIRGRALRVWSGGRSLSAGAPPGELGTRLGLQGVEPGLAQLDRASGTLELRVYEWMAVDAAGERVDLALSHASLSRTLPDSLRSEEERGAHDGDALRWLVIGPDPGLPREMSLVSLAMDGRVLGGIERVPLARVACPSGTAPGLGCHGGPMIRATTDVLDGQHPRAPEPSLHAEVGGRIVLFSGGVKAASIRVGGPRQSRLGPLERYRGKLRMRVLRTGPGGGVSVGSSVAGGLSLARQELRVANALWGQCGIQFGDPAELDVQVVDPPPPHMFAVGCGLGLPASGGTLAVRVAGRRFELRTERGAPPTQVARQLAGVLHRAGFQAVLSPNPRESFSAAASVDVLVRGARGQYVSLQLLHGVESSERTLELCVGGVSLSDGLSHFSDADAATGTLEERSLLKALVDDDPASIDVLVLPYFASVGRVGESFVDATGLGVRNAIIVDRAGVRAGARSFALAHELGHVLLQVAGHPDDFGSDLPTSLMDADAADASIFGPRRLSVAECERAILQSGPDAPLPLLRRWPLTSRPAR
jgi:hypothetical protein